MIWERLTKGDVFYKLVLSADMEKLIATPHGLGIEVEEVEILDIIPIDLSFKTKYGELTLDAKEFFTESSAVLVHDDEKAVMIIATTLPELTNRLGKLITELMEAKDNDDDYEEEN